MANRNTPEIVNAITHVRTGPWAVNYHSDDFVAGSLNVELKAAPAAPGAATYITHVSMGMVAEKDFDWTYDCSLTLVDGGGSEMFGPVQFESSGQTTFSKDFEYPMKVTDNKALDITGSSRSGYEPACWVYIEGWTGTKPIG